MREMKSYKMGWISLVAGFFLAGFFLNAFASPFPKSFPFSDQRALDEWQEKIFRGKVLYTVKTAGHGQGFLQAHSLSASSGLIHRLKLDINRYPMISWQWRVKTFPGKKIQETARGGWVEQDDYAARVYVIFLSWNIARIQSLEYVWDEVYPEGTILPSPFSNNIKLVVVESGVRNLDQWVKEERNIHKDYQKAFGRRPPRIVGAIALMTDSDNSMSSAETFYKDLKVGY
jgi:hypothetical protein